jgi:hypothetical protein
MFISVCDGLPWTSVLLQVLLLAIGQFTSPSLRMDSLLSIYGLPFRVGGSS